MTKNEAIREFERNGYTFTGYKDAGWGEKLYHFTHPSIPGEDCYHLSLLRSKARRLETKRWHDEWQAELRAGIQKTLFTDTEIEGYYFIENPLEVAA